MKLYEPMTIKDLIHALAAMEPDAPISLSTNIDSYRGRYKHVAIDPDGTTTAGELREALLEMQGTTMTGYKGGDFPVTEDCLVFLAGWGDLGPMLVDFEGAEPVACEEAWTW